MPASSNSTDPAAPPARSVSAFQLRAYLAAFLRGDFALGFFRQIGVQAFAVIMLIEAIFLAEHFTWVFRDAVRHDAGLFDIILVLACSGTSIFDLALAIAVLMASYATLVRMRESRELLVLFASGLGPYQLSALILGVALAAQIICLTGSGLIDPVSRYVQRSILFSTELRSLKKGAAQGEFYYFPSYVAYAADTPAGTGELPVLTHQPGQPVIIDARPGNTNDRPLFVYQQIAEHASRVVTASRARLDGPNKDGKIILNLGDFTSHTFADAHPLGGPDAQPLKPGQVKCIDCLDDLKNVPRVTMRVRDMSQMMMVDQLLPFGRRGSEAEEGTLLEEVLGLGDNPANRAAHMQLLAERFARSLLTALAPLMALAALALTTRFTNWFALPLACLVLMATDLVCEWLITHIAPMGIFGALAPPLAFFLAIAGLVLWVVLRRQGDLVRPQLTRS